MEKGLVGKRLQEVPPPLKPSLDKAWSNKKPGIVLISVGLRLGDVKAQQAALDLVSDEKRPESERIKLIEILGETGQVQAVPHLLAICEKSTSRELKGAALRALQRFPDLSVGQTILVLFRKFDADLRDRVTDMLSSRLVWADLLVKQVETGEIRPEEVSRGHVQQMAAFKDSALNQRIEKLWGKFQTESAVEKQSTINRLKLVLKPSGVAGRDAKGDPDEGKKLFLQNCAVCHKLFGDGNIIGPDLTGMDRKNTDFMLANIVDPGAYIRPEYLSYDLETTDDQVISGVMVESMPAAVVLLDRNNQRHTISRQQIKQLKESQVSMMPEGLLEALQPQQIMDLFSYLQR